MSLKDNISAIKSELNSEEKFFEKAVLTEKFIKKYKNVIIALVVGAIVVAVANVAYEVNEKSKRDSANAALMEVLKDANNQNALSELQASSPALYDVLKYSRAINAKDSQALEKLKDSKTPLIGDLSTYEAAKDESSLKNYSLKQDSFYKELATIEVAVTMLEESKIQEAHNLLKSIPASSPLHSVATKLLHYGVQ